MAKFRDVTNQTEEEVIAEVEHIEASAPEVPQTIGPVDIPSVVTEVSTGQPHPEKPSEEMAWAFIDWLSYLEPAWKDRIEALMDERHIGPVNTIGLLAGWTLESGMHMEISILPQLMDDYNPAGSQQQCPECNDRYKLLYPQQPFCSNKCAEAWHAANQDKKRIPVIPLGSKAWKEMTYQERAAHLNQRRYLRK